MKRKVIIIGGGIAGLTAAFQLKKQGIDGLILESSNRLGGRIFTKAKDNLRFELGATWVFDDPYLKALIQELGLELYPQYLNGDGLIKYEPSMSIQKSSTEALMNGAIYHKVKGGTGAIVDALASHLDAKQIQKNSQVCRIKNQEDCIRIELADGTFLQTEKVILAIPPKSISESIQFCPRLDQDQVMQMTHTWMAESSKFTVFLDQDYWRQRNLSGFVYSNYGLIREMQDHQSQDGKSFGLVGFIRVPDNLRDSLDKRRNVVVQELVELFGIKAEHIIGYEDFLWKDHFCDAKGRNYNEDLIPHQNNGYPFYSKTHFEGNLVFAGAETSRSNPGYMEGAVRSAFHALKLLRI